MTRTLLVWCCENSNYVISCRGKFYYLYYLSSQRSDATPALPQTLSQITCPSSAPSSYHSCDSLTRPRDTWTSWLRAAIPSPSKASNLMSLINWQYEGIHKYVNKSDLCLNYPHDTSDRGWLTSYHSRKTRSIYSIYHCHPLVICGIAVWTFKKTFEEHLLLYFTISIFNMLAQPSSYLPYEIIYLIIPVCMFGGSFLVYCPPSSEERYWYVNVYVNNNPA